ncbi:hypothetical protein [Pseudomonas wadenswilerensis]|uniref:Uncharacterized protein n=1 Tax=Pseudomonas wadenswilerensis TaxID=1785161 RepID=A0A380T1T1_9PSED|nr:hypothetical protein [Pseudomonas wadenswilerensis]SUQ64189.1 hypothetical protein CCOS864_03644 [Pseudomonas wadenswilerensis]
MRCFILGADLTRDAWLVVALRSRRYSVVDIPHCNLLQIHLEAGGLCELLLHEQRLSPEDRLFFLRVPRLPIQVDAAQGDFAYSEWRAALEAALYTRATQVLNGEWVLKNFGLRSSDTFWTRMCQKLCSASDSLRLEWPGNAESYTTAPTPCLEVTVTRRRWASELPLLYEVERHSASLLGLQEALRVHRLDFLRVWIDPSPGPLRITRASAELPTEPSLSFEMVLDDFL